MGAPTFNPFFAGLDAKRRGFAPTDPRAQAEVKAGFDASKAGRVFIPQNYQVPGTQSAQAPTVAQAPGTPNPTTAAKKRRSGTILTNPQGLTSTQSTGTTLVSA